MEIHNLSVAENLAVDLRRDLGILLDAPIDFAYIFHCLNIHFRKAPLGNNVLGASKVEGLKRLIVVSDDKRHAAQERFTTAHELGHIVLRHGYTLCKYTDIFSQKTHKEKEVEANAFASALLLPPSVVANTAQRGRITINAAGKLAKQYDVSLTSAIISLVKSSPLSVCVFSQTNGKIDYSISSSNCCVRARSGNVCPGNGIHAVGPTQRQYNRVCESSNWFYVKPDIEYNCSEETIYLPSYQRALSIVEVWEKD